jgi:hypothetical protein
MAQKLHYNTSSPRFLTRLPSASSGGPRRRLSRLLSKLPNNSREKLIATVSSPRANLRIITTEFRCSFLSPFVRNLTFYIGLIDFISDDDKIGCVVLFSFDYRVAKDCEFIEGGEGCDRVEEDEALYSAVGKEYMLDA